MIDLHVSTFVIGLAGGAGSAALYLAGLALGIRLALRRQAVALLLLGSATLRIALLLMAGAAVARLGPSALLGFALGFVLARSLIVACVRPRAVAPADALPPPDSQPWN